MAVVDELVRRVLDGSYELSDPRAIGRLLSLIETDGAQQREIARSLHPYVRGAEVVGLTGPPGVGKSTLVSSLVTGYRKRGRRVGVLAVDPTSPFTGGALLGDRVRMQEHATDPGVFIRSMASRGHLGGLAAATPQAIRVLDAAGADVVLLETVGVGQSEVEVAGLADSTLVLLAPDSGDAVQVAKAGVLEVGDIYVVNKADRDGAPRLSRDLRQALNLAAASEWKPPILQVVATSQDSDPVLDAIADHRSHLADGAGLEQRRSARLAREVEALAVAAVRARLGELPRGERLEELVQQVSTGELDPYTAADALITNVVLRTRFDASGSGKS